MNRRLCSCPWREEEIEGEIEGADLLEENVQLAIANIENALSPKVERRIPLHLCGEILKLKGITQTTVTNIRNNKRIV